MPRRKVALPQQQKSRRREQRRQQQQQTAPILTLPVDVLRYHICPLLSRADIAALFNATCKQMRAAHRLSLYANCQDPPHLLVWYSYSDDTWRTDYTRSRLVPHRRDDNDVNDGGYETNEVATMCVIDCQLHSYGRKTEASLMRLLKRAFDVGYRIRHVRICRASALWIIGALDAVLHARHKPTTVELTAPGIRSGGDGLVYVDAHAAEDPLDPQPSAGELLFKRGEFLMDRITRLPQHARDYLRSSVHTVLIERPSLVAPLLVVRELFDPDRVWHVALGRVVHGVAHRARVLFASGSAITDIDAQFLSTRRLTGVPPILIGVTGPPREFLAYGQDHNVPDDYRGFARELLANSNVPVSEHESVVRELRWAAHVVAVDRPLVPRGIQHFVGVREGLAHITLESLECGFALPRLTRAAWEQLTDLRSIWVHIECDCVPADYDRRLDPFRARQFEALVEQARSRRPADVTVVRFRRVATEVLWDYSVVVKWTDAADADVRETVCRAVNLLGICARPPGAPPRRSGRILQKAAAAAKDRRRESMRG